MPLMSIRTESGSVPLTLSVACKLTGCVSGCASSPRTQPVCTFVHSLQPKYA